MSGRADWEPHPARQLDVRYCAGLEQTLLAASHCPPAALPAMLPHAACLELLRRCERLLKAEPTLLQVQPPPGAQVVVVGDLHGQLHDLLAIFQRVGRPSEQLVYVFDGDYVDRGAWSLELLLLLAAWKAALPRHSVLLRGNHESTYCSIVYGFYREVQAKYGEGKEGQALFAACQRLFMHLPLAAVVAGNTLVLHGGLPRAPPRRATRRTSAAAAAEGDRAVTIASLSEVAAASKGGQDPDPAEPEQRLACDILWSDPGSQPGIVLGARPGDVGILFGPDVTERFLRDHGLRLILRGHEGPDARVLRTGEMQPMQAGYTLDHQTPSGRLYTVFSAPDYPQFGATRHGNLGAVAVLSAPSYDSPEFVQFAAAERPQATSFMPELPTEDAEAAAAAAAAGAGDLSSQPLVKHQDEGELNQQQQQRQREPGGNEPSGEPNGTAAVDPINLSSSSQRIAVGLCGADTVAEAQADAVQAAAAAAGRKRKAGNAS